MWAEGRYKLISQNAQPRICEFPGRGRYPEDSSCNDQAHNPALNLNLSALYSRTPLLLNVTMCLKWNILYPIAVCGWWFIGVGWGERICPEKTARRCDWWGVGPKVSTARPGLVFQEVRRYSQYVSGARKCLHQGCLLVMIGQILEHKYFSVRSWRLFYNAMWPY